MRKSDVTFLKHRDNVHVLGLARIVLETQTNRRAALGFGLPSKLDSPVRTFGGRRARRSVICQVVANGVAGGRQAVKKAMYNDVNACAIVRAAP